MFFDEVMEINNKVMLNLLSMFEEYILLVRKLDVYWLVVYMEFIKVYWDNKNFYLYN